MRFFLDEGVPRSAGRYLESEGFEVIYLADAIATGSSDDHVIIAALANDAVLIAQDNDMRTAAKRHGISNSRFKRLSLLKLSCPEPSAASTIKNALPHLRLEWDICCEKRARRLFIELQAAGMKINWV